MTEADIAKDVLAAARKIHAILGPGLSEVAYQPVLVHELEKRGHTVQSHVPIPIVYDGISLKAGLYADLIVDDLVIVDVRSAEHLSSTFKRQTKTFVRLSNKRLGILLNFGAERLEDGTLKIVNRG